MRSLLSLSVADLRLAIRLKREHERISAQIAKINRRLEALGTDVGDRLTSPGKARKPRKKLSPEVKAKMAAAQKARWAAKKAKA
ncbi:hypothetical protein SAMN05444156_2181 [Verrucomicrobium sp. GAS474]|uniref:hypothetical protein n=1 Tax=Verrucomicrobium sp. GAS474 TaxID=1882831 RepID=UPI00087ABE03|nr:hypothetical protein [Verrucomicrobium sp. GAS474]SDU13736.1 hypothetical protein SAMN05444156_2181 [Verrucomicrobium sp. GAS474]